MSREPSELLQVVRSISAVLSSHEDTPAKKLLAIDELLALHGLGPVRAGKWDLAEAVRLYEAGGSTRAVGRLFGITGETARVRLKQAGVRFRPSGCPRTSRDKERLVVAGYQQGL